MKFCGGDTKKEDINWWYEYFKENPRTHPAEMAECVCHHWIKENCYIHTHKNEILVLGNCCIKKFITQDKRRCNICERPHKNRITNKCKECKKEILDELKQSIKNLKSYNSLIKKYL
jgi:hypothetical protein